MKVTPRRRRKSGPNPVDIHVGSRVRLRRNMLGLSQEKLGEAIGLTFQQVQKYERGANRIGASRLLELSRVLDVPISFFYDDTDPVRAAPVVDADSVDDPLARPDIAELVDAFNAIRSNSVRGRVFDLARALAIAPSPIASA